MPASSRTTSMSGQYVIPVPYGRHAPPQDAHAGPLRDAPRAPRPPGFADPRIPDDGHHAAGALIAGSGEVVQELLQLAFATDERGALRRCAPVRFGEGAPRPYAARNAGTGSTLPFAVIGSRPSYSIASRVRRLVSAPTTTSPGSTPACSLAATLTASPVTRKWRSSPVPATTSPLFTPIRSAKANPRSAPEVGDRVAHRERRPHRPFGVIFV